MQKGEESLACLFCLRGMGAGGVDESVEMSMYGW